MMYKITFQYKDKMSRGQWRSQSCTLSAHSREEAIKKCRELYGLGYDCEYKIVSVDVISK